MLLPYVCALGTTEESRIKQVCQDRPSHNSRIVSISTLKYRSSILPVPDSRNFPQIP